MNSVFSTSSELARLLAVEATIIIALAAVQR
jgi:hypothetical protein